MVVVPCHSVFYFLGLVENLSEKVELELMLMLMDVLVSLKRSLHAMV